MKRFHANAAFPAVQQAPAISPSTAPRPIYTVDTTSDTNPATPTVACQSGNANTCSVRAAIAAVNKGTGTPIAEIKIPKLTTNYLLSTSLGTLTIRRSVLLYGTTSSDSGIKINPDTKSRVLTVEKTILSPTTPRVYIRNLDLTSGKTTKGGDIYIQTADVIMTNDLIESGTAKFGGLIFMTGIGANLWASNTHFLNGYTTGSSTDSGGAITNTGGMAVLVHDTFSKCSAVYGGAIANYGTISDQASGYSTNYAVDGGAIYNTGQLFETTSTFQKNYVTKTTGMVYGGALSNNGHASLQGDSFTQNFAKDSESIEGVTIYNSGSLTGTKVTIGISRAKSATQIWGGAITNDYSTTATISTKGKSRPFMKINGLTVHTTYDQTTSAGYEHSVYGGAIFDAGQAIISTATISHTYVLTSLTATPGSEVVYGGAIDAFAETGPTSTLYPADFTLHGATVRTTVVKMKDGIVAGGAISLGTMNFLLTTATSFKATGETMVIETVLVTTTTVSSGTGKIWGGGVLIGTNGSITDVTVETLLVNSVGTTVRGGALYSAGGVSVHRVALYTVTVFDERLGSTTPNGSIYGGGWFATTMATGTNVNIDHIYLGAGKTIKGGGLMTYGTTTINASTIAHVTATMTTGSLSINGGAAAFLSGKSVVSNMTKCGQNAI